MPLLRGCALTALLIPITLATPANAAPPVNECAQPRPEWIWCDDFEEDRLAAYFEASMPRRAGVGRDGSYGAVGRYSLERSEAGNLKLAFGRTPGPSFRPVDGGRKDYREVFWRVYVLKPEGWQGGGADKLSRATVFAERNWAQAMIAHVWSGADPGPRQAYLNIDPASGIDDAGRLRAARYNDFDNLRWLGARSSRMQVFGAEQVGRWQCIEARVQLNEPGRSNGVFQLWLNDELAASRKDLDWVGRYSDYGINAIFLENYWNSRSPVAQERYMDNVVVSTARIGCG